MNTADWLNKTQHLNTDGRVPLSQLVVSTEAFYDPVINWFKVKSNKGQDYKPVEQKHTYNNKALVTAISRQYGNPLWLKRQHWVSGSVPAGDVIPYIGPVGSAIDILKTHTTAAEFYLRVHKDWEKAVKAYYKAIAPALLVLSKGLTDEAYEDAQAVLKRSGDAPSFYRTAPSMFPVMARVLPKKEHFDLREIRSLNEPTRLKALNKDTVEKVVASITSVLLDAEKINVSIKESSTKATEKAMAPALYKLAHSGSAQAPKDSKYSTEQWVALAKAIDPMAVYWSSVPFTTTRTCYSELVLAITKWIDRSIR